MKIREGRNELKISGWVQYSSKDFYEVCEIVKLYVNIGGTEVGTYIDMTGDEMLAWCAEHGFPCTDMRERAAS